MRRASRRAVCRILVCALVASALLSRAVAAEEGQPDDPARDQVAMTPTAWMQPTGLGSFTFFVLLGGRFVAAVHRRLQLDVQGLLPNPRANQGTLGASFLVHERHLLRVVVRGDAGGGIDHDTDDGFRPYVRSFVVARRAMAAGLGVISSACFARACRTSATVGIRGGWTEVDGEGYSETSFTASAVTSVGRPLLFGHGSVDFCNRPSGCYGLAGEIGAGIRFAATPWALDLGWTKLLADKQENLRVVDLTPVGSPWFAVTYAPR